MKSQNLFAKIRFLDTPSIFIYIDSNADETSSWGSVFNMYGRGNY